jgi:hypothetical protein
MRKYYFAASLAVLASLFALLTCRAVFEHDEPRISDPSKVETDPPVQLETAKVGSRVEAVAAQEPHGELVVLIGTVVSAETELPLEATVTVGEQEFYSDATTGHFRCAANTSAVALTVSAMNFEPVAVRLDANGKEKDLGEIRLSPERRLVIEVVGPAMEPIGGATVFQATGALVDGYLTEKLHALGLTDDTGRLAVAIAGPSVFCARLGDRCAVTELVDGYKAEIRLRLPDSSGRSIGVRAGTGEPLRGIPLSLTRIGGYPWLEYARSTAADGIISESVPEGSYMVQCPDARFDLQGPTKTFFGAKRIVLSTGGTEPVSWMECTAVSQADACVVLVEGGGGELVGARGWPASFEEPPFVEYPRAVRLGSTVHASDGGSHLFLSQFVGLDGSMGLCVHVPGYETRYLPPEDLVLIQPGAPLRVALARQPLANIRVIDGSGDGYPYTVQLREKGSGEILAVQVPGLGGLVGPFQPPDADIEVALGPHSGAKVLGLVPPSRFAGDAIPTLELEALSSIVIVGVPAEPPRLFCADGRGFVATGRRAGNEVIFPSLFPGEYEVCTRGILETLSVRVGLGQKLTLNLPPATVLRVDWNPRWQKGLVTTGQVTAVGVSCSELVAMPLFGDVDGLIATGGRTRSFPLEGDGRYTLSGLDAMPEHVAFARVLDQGRALPLAIIRPDEHGIILCGDVDVEIQNVASGEEVSVRVRPILPGYSLTAVEEFSRTGPGTIRIGAIPVDTRLLEVIGRTRKKTLTVDLAAGETVRVTADLSQ